MSLKIPIEEMSVEPKILVPTESEQKNLKPNIIQTEI